MGFVTGDPSDMQFPARATTPVARVAITAIRCASWQTITNHDGEYQLTGVPPGSYGITAALPGVPQEQTLQGIDLAAGGLLAVEFFGNTGRIYQWESHRFDSGVLVEIEALPPASAAACGTPRTTKAGLRRHNSRPESTSRIPWQLLPRRTDRAAAQVLRLEAVQKIEKLELRVPPRSPQIVLVGEVVWPDGSPAEASVWLVNLDFPAESCHVDFAALAGVEGRRYAVFAHVEERDQHTYSRVLEKPEAEGRAIRLVLSNATSHEDCGICKRFPQLFASPLWVK